LCGVGYTTSYDDRRKAFRVKCWRKKKQNSDILEKGNSNNTKIKGERRRRRRTLNV
jgi:hypothetical protein